MSAEDALYRRFADVVGVKLTTEKDGTISAEKAKEASVSLEDVAIASFFDEIEKISKDLTVEDKEKLPEDSSGVVLVNLSRIAALSGDRPAAKTILADALSREQHKGDAANKETLRLISAALRSLDRHTR